MHLIGSHISLGWRCLAGLCLGFLLLSKCFITRVDVVSVQLCIVSFELVVLDEVFVTHLEHPVDVAVDFALDLTVAD